MTESGMQVFLRPLEDEVRRRLRGLSDVLRSAVIAPALDEIGEEINATAYEMLSGPTDRVKRNRKPQKGQPRRKHVKRSLTPGGIPIPIVTGNLRRRQMLVYPGRKGLSLTEIAFENSALYAMEVFENEDNPRPVIDLAIEKHIDRLDGLIAKNMESVV